MQLLDRAVVGGEAGQAKDRRVPEEDFRKRLADDRPNAPALQRLRRMLTRRSAAKISVDEQHGCVLVTRVRKRMQPAALGQLFPIVLEHVRFEPFEGHRLQEPGGDDPIGVDVMAAQRHRAAGDLVDETRRRGHDACTSSGWRIVRTSTTSPAMAAAATMAGLINSVRPVGLPCRPLKLRLDEDAQIWRP